MDFNIGSVLYFGARGIGYVYDKELEWITDSSKIRYSSVDKMNAEKYTSELADNRKISEFVEEKMRSDETLQTLIANSKTNEATRQEKITVNKLTRKAYKKYKQEYLNTLKEKYVTKQNLSKTELNELQHRIKQNSHLVHSKLFLFSYISAARVVLLGFGSDELLGGYGRHRTSYRLKGKEGLMAELNKDWNRLWKRNLGRDDRLISDHSREARHPFLDERLIDLIKNKLPVHYLCDLNDSEGIGDKKILRDSAYKLGLKKTCSLVKRAIQFGTKIADNKVAGYAQITPDLKIEDLINNQAFEEQNTK
ncbi:hypothetical protein RFI_22013 [Reticulomyxa filosa]|uniref:Asparagine synthetase domain-containing protein n=1 Tax=Reticulomyxa filosa TaxID=46433 RepID=X6MMX8_RETFI|nr:hypothetical protein RFI_22013 [Reticulomyxa filosa]|eukprot:ETO15348.1 hypothetical protein RFI_22013 [Reticulomyxa filosa]